MFFCQAEKAIRCAMARKDFNANEMKLVIEDVMGETPLDNPKLKQVVEKIDAMTGWKSIKASVKELLTICKTNYVRELEGNSQQNFAFRNSVLVTKIKS